MTKIIVITGPTASGKSDLAVKVAKKFNGEVISADSRQVYKGLDIGTGKITKKEMRGVKHHLLDVMSPQKTFTAENFKKIAEECILNIHKKGKIPIICGGTGFYISALINKTHFPSVLPDKNLRAQLEKKTVESLFDQLKKTDPIRAKSIDHKNKRRIIRAIEIVKKLGSVPPITSSQNINLNNDEYILIGTKVDSKILKDRIKKRLISRIKKGMIKEAEKLHKKGLSYKRMRELGLEYRFLADLLDNKISKEDMIEKLNTAIWHYAKRQMTWWKKNKEIKWFSPKDISKIYKEIRPLVRESGFVKKTK